MTGTLIDVTGLTKFGNMTSGSGLTAIFDNNTGTFGYSEATTGYVGVALSTATAIDHVDFISATNGFDASGSTSAITLKIYGKQGSAPTSMTDGTLLGTLGSFTDVNATTTKTIASTDTTTAWDYVWGTLSTGVWCILGELKLYAVDSSTGTPSGTPLQQTSNVFSITKSINTTTPLTWTASELTGFRQGVFVETAAVATVNFQMDVIDNYLGGYSDAIGISSYLLIRSGTTWAATQSATFTQVPNVVSGGNIASITDHYGTISLIAKIPLVANKYYEFSILAAGNSTAASSNGLASVLVEGGIGLNYFMITVNKNEVIVS